MCLYIYIYIYIYTINIQFIPLTQEGSKKECIVIASTSNYIYYFTGTSNFENLFERYKDQSKVKENEIPFI